MPVQQYPHIKITTVPSTQNFTTAKSLRGSANIPERNREEHGRRLRAQLNTVLSNIQEDLVRNPVADARQGIYLEFKSDAGRDLVTKSLEDTNANVRLLNVHTNQESAVVTATVFVPNEKIDFFSNKLTHYQDRDRDTPTGKPKNKDLIESIGEINQALVESFWCDPLELIPEEVSKWCEVWLRIDSHDNVQTFNSLLEEHNIQSTPNVINFPERAVKVVNVNREQLVLLSRHSDNIAEYRLAKESALLWTEMPPREQAEWTDDLLTRIENNQDQNVSICILDTGINNGHVLLSSILDTPDCQTVNASWDINDHDGHGTMMAGIAAYGNLEKCLATTGSITLKHQLESIKILPPPPEENHFRLWGFLTKQGVSLAEIQAPNTKRVICMAITSNDVRDKGRPSSWSAAVDAITSGAEDGTKRLMILSAGNTEVTEFTNPANYPYILITDSIHDPAQSWNAITVGAYTELHNITDPTLANYTPLAPHNTISPFTTTSSVWEDRWPIKPEIVMEGGNLAVDNTFITECEDLSKLTTNFKPHQGHFTDFRMTSLATAQASWLAAQIQVKYPEFWPETIRALMIHSAKWTDELIAQFDIDVSNKTSVKKLLRICGYGVPSLERALYSASNSLTLIAEEVIQPFIKVGNDYKTKDMHFHELPWPKEVLQDLPAETEVEMRVTLSYFIEPGPGEIGRKDAYRYASHMLRFEINSPGETEDELIRRINKKARNAENGKPDTKSAASHWVIGQARDKGSIHSDIWKGTAAELADSNKIVIYPGIGWWRERKKLGKYNKQTRYSLVVSISTPSAEVDIYTPVATQIGIMTPIEIEV
ncbi:MAG: S8 family serine peptidase [Sulfurimonadaceae bacterium]